MLHASHTTFKTPITNHPLVSQGVTRVNDKSEVTRIHDGIIFHNSCDI